MSERGFICVISVKSVSRQLSPQTPDILSRYCHPRSAPPRSDVSEVGAKPEVALPALPGAAENQRRVVGKKFRDGARLQPFAILIVAVPAASGLSAVISGLHHLPQQRPRQEALAVGFVQNIVDVAR